LDQPLAFFEPPTPKQMGGSETHESAAFVGRGVLRRLEISICSAAAAPAAHESHRELTPERAVFGGGGIGQIETHGVELGGAFERERRHGSFGGCQPVPKRLRAFAGTERESVQPVGIDSGARFEGAEQSRVHALQLSCIEAAEHTVADAIMIKFE
jgi:hypothetical protein